MIGTPREIIVWLLAIKDSDKLFRLEEHRKKRTLTQNAYYWQLLGQVADALRMSKTELHNRMLADYGQIDKDLRYVIMRDDIDWKALDTMHLKPTASVKTMDNGVLYRVYLVIRGSSTYNTKEMSVLVDGMVQEAKQQGIETMTPAELSELRRMEQERENRKNGRVEADRRHD